jgi:hypothetical protein
MKHIIGRYILILGLAAAGWVWNGEIRPTFDGNLLATAEAVVGAPATPVSYAGVARRSTVGAGAPGVGVTPGAGVGAPGVGVTPGVGAGAPGPGAAPANRGGPVNRVGVR